jgi:putative cardiolipin synthase
MLIENAYFVPRERMVEILADAVDRGVRVRVLTNSLASNDVVAVHAGYKKHRDDLLAHGVEIYELRPDSAMKEEWSLLSTQSRAGLHAKTMLVDGRRAVIGSYNLDPRSADINTELVLLVESADFGKRLEAFLNDGVAPENAYRVRLEDGGLVWTTQAGGEKIVHRTEPETSRWQRFLVGLLGILPIQSQL